MSCASQIPEHSILSCPRLEMCWHPTAPARCWIDMFSPELRDKEEAAKGPFLMPGSTLAIDITAAKANFYSTRSCQQYDQN